MEPSVTNLLYRRPEPYEAIYDGAANAVPRMCERLFERHLGRTPDSLLDLGRSIGRDLEYVARLCPGCIGVDYTQLLERRRTWTVRGEQVHDHVRFRLPYPPELAHHLSTHGFHVLQMSDDPDLTETDMTGPSMFVVAEATPAPTNRPGPPVVLASLRRR
ncbi:MAG TPA: hypothetical protein VLJ59_13160 [Mycobacteriales bacterium]|nr:hypothetical protein [Mycobacteriales bacterium]